MIPAFLGVTLGALIQLCAPAVAPRTALAVIAVESGGQPWAVGDNTSGKAHFFTTRAEAERFATGRLEEGANLDLGLTQVNSDNLRRLGVRLGEIFDPCINVWAGMRILREDFLRATQSYGAPEAALFHAFEAYNAGSFIGAPAYAKNVWQTAVSIPAIVNARTATDGR